MNGRHKCGRCEELTYQEEDCYFCQYVDWILNSGAEPETSGIRESMSNVDLSIGMNYREGSFLLSHMVADIEVSNGN